VLLEPVYEKIKQAKQDKEQELVKLESKFEGDLSSMEKMRQSTSLPAEAKKKYLAAFKEKWTDYVSMLRNETLMSRYKILFPPPAGTVETVRVNGVDIEMVYVPGGTFMMGSPSNGKDRNNDEVQHQVMLTKGYWIGKYEVTQEQWQAVMGNNPANKFGVGNRYPVYYVSWNDCQEFIQKLNSLTGQNFALPTEAQWEYAARGGPSSKGYVYSGSNNINDVAEYYGNNNKSTKPVGGRQANELGIYDMSGNVWEWCEDWIADYPGGSVTNPTGPSNGSYRVVRGGCWYSKARYCRSADRGNFDPSDRDYSLGFRLVRH
jgi:formylglycine-generating enzyme required for sulfatase activity